LNDQPASAAPAVTAGLGRRLGSLCYEVLLLAAILFFGGWAFLFPSRNLDPALARPLLQLVLFALTAAYFTYCWTHGGQTLPMKTWRIRLVMRDGNAISLGTGMRRYAFAVIGIGLCGLGLIWALFDRERQFLHDRLAGTKIVRTGD
jgi:uncharacterized RDD family membrane protein YckC